ncbi:DUF1572 domain-containing protein [Paenibacillus radicis (ex Xue et al. 2023)]|uniref:DUF1572 domain-containing protein n=1 Tax=Paenibacillus radicis (ex Xue et al. 2023) TaxID=2972489 RepID=A0ABT1YA98_9BACL|nr:DUF1572 domain-containing protein [Paenibacillus radicis (ex Xue et al. 2023)]MCR8630115.1 DUF1572 domain-containing protein [Paenibacillus radicis (ex Xue et al. 2023)]
MNYEFNRNWLIAKFRELQDSMLKVLEQLDDEHVNWRPNNYSNSISNLIMHINGYIKERIEKGILHRTISRSRDEELGAIIVPNEELQQLIKERFDFVISTIECITEEQLDAIQVVRGSDRTNLDMLHQCAAHFSEHVGQILYIAKLRLRERYKSLTGPIKPKL